MLEHRIYSVRLIKAIKYWIIVFKEYDRTQIRGYIIYSYATDTLYPGVAVLCDIEDVQDIRECTQQEIEDLRKIASFPPLEDYGDKRRIV